jgi:hypothetical protein
MKKHPFLQKAVLAIISCTFTILVFMNAAEVVLNVDLPLANSVERADAQSAINEIARSFAIKPGINQAMPFGLMDHLQSLEVSSLNVHVQLEEARKINGAWYLRPSFGNYLGINKDPKGTVIDYLIYLRESWRTIPDGAQLDPGTEVVLRYDKGKTTYKVSEKQLLPDTQSAILSKTEDRQILLLAEDNSAHAYYAFSLIQER